MSEIRVRRSHSMPHARARKEAEKIAVDLRDKYELEYAWEGDVIRFERTGVTGRLVVGKDEVHLEAKLGFLLAFLKPTIEGHINENFDRVFNDQTRPASAKAKPAAKPPSPAATKSAPAKPVTKAKK